MRFLTIVSLIIFLAFACKDKSTSPLRKGKANKIIAGSRKLDSVRLQLIKTYDPYNKGYTYQYTDSSALTYLSLYGDGTFKKYNQDNLSKGRWYLNKSKDKLAFVFSFRNGIIINESLQQMAFRHHIDSVYQDTLVLSIQGRHGMVKYYYHTPSDTPAISLDSLNSDTLSITENLLDSLAKDSLPHPPKN